jgi:soluble lytic murein transglycosylase
MPFPSSPPGMDAPAYLNGIVRVQAAEPGDDVAVRMPRPRPDASEAGDQANESGSGSGAGVESPAQAEVAADGNPPADSEAPAAADTDPTPNSDSAAASAVAAESNRPPAPLPRPRPELSAAAAARYLQAQFYGFAPDHKLKAALDAVEQGRYAEARRLASEHENALVPAILDWVIARQSDSDLSPAEIIAILENHRGWPEPERLFLRAEQAFHAPGPDSQAILTFYGTTPPRTVGGKLALAGALREAGRRDEAAEIVRALWRDWPLASNQAGAVLARFSAMLSREDHLYRFRRLVLSRQTSEAVAQAELLGPGYAGLARGVIASLDSRAEAPGPLRSVTPDFFDDPLYVFARVRALRRSGQPIEAARLLLRSEAEGELPGEGDVWWDERRDLSRMLLDRGVADLAYQVADGARPLGEGNRVEATFHAGWYALRFLNDPASAEPHFRELHALATLPRTQSRASYWLGRTNEAKGREAAARLDYVEAARFGGSFYGQLARERLGMVTTGLERIPRPSALDRIRFADRDAVKVIRLLAAAGHAERAFLFLRTLGETVDTAGEVSLLSNLARRIGLPNAGRAAAAIAEERGLRVASLSAPFLGVPTALPLPERVDRPLVYAVVRQESAFDHSAVSHAGARGLMQLMPATARATARSIRIPFSVQRLTTDPLYNATLGAYHLGELLGGLGSSYVLTFVGYNAGPGRAIQWVKDYGDPRSGNVDTVDWIERIPFDETRDYVQKVMENLQVYRSRIGYPLSLSRDLVRAGPQG